MNLIEVADLTYRYPQTEQPALKNLDLVIPEGQFCGLVGANGAGKSTLCYALAGFIPHHFRGRLEGSVRLAGRSISETPLYELAGAIGLVFQNPFNQISGARYTVVEEVAFGLENLAVPREEMEGRVDHVLALTGLTELAGRSPFNLSGGQQQRLAIASVLAMAPRLLVLDEPTAHLDPAGTREVFLTLRALAEAGGTTVVLVEHKLEWLAAFADRVVAMANGEIAADGAPGEVLTDPAMGQLGIGTTRFTAAARAAQAAGLVEPGRRLPVTLEEATAFFDAAAS